MGRDPSEESKVLWQHVTWHLSTPGGDIDATEGKHTGQQEISETTGAEQNVTIKQEILDRK